MVAAFTSFVVARHLYDISLVIWGSVSVLFKVGIFQPGHARSVLLKILPHSPQACRQEKPLVEELPFSEWRRTGRILGLELYPNPMDSRLADNYTIVGSNVPSQFQDSSPEPSSLAFSSVRGGGYCAVTTSVDRLVVRRLFLPKFVVEVDPFSSFARHLVTTEYYYYRALFLFASRIFLRNPTPSLEVRSGEHLN